MSHTPCGMPTEAKVRGTDTTTPISTRAAQPIWLSLDVADRDFRETALADIPLIPGDRAHDCRVHWLRVQESSVMRWVSVGAKPGAPHKIALIAEPDRLSHASVGKRLLLLEAV